MLVPLIQADMRHLPFRKGSFDGLWVCASLLHIPKEQAGEVLRELSRVVYPGHISLAVKRGEGEDVGGRTRRGSGSFLPTMLAARSNCLMERNGFEVL